MVQPQFSFIHAGNRQIQTVALDRVIGLDQNRRHRYVIIRHANRETRVQTTESLKVLRQRLDSETRRAEELRSVSAASSAA